MATNGSKDVAEMAEGARDTLRELQGRVGERLEDMRGFADTADAAVREFARERPLLAIACAAGIGFIIGRLASRA